MKTEIRLSEESGILISLKYLIKEAAKILYKGMSPFLWCLKMVLGKLFDLWHNFYEFMYCKRKKILRVWFTGVGIYWIILSIILCVQTLFFNKFSWTFLWFMLGIAGGSLALLMILVIYHLIIGQDIVLLQQAVLTEYYVEIGLPHNVKYVGARRIGKDSSMTAFTTLIIKIFKRQIVKTMKKIIKICYIFDFEKVNKACRTYAKCFYHPAETKRRDEFIKICKQANIQAFLTDKALEKIQYEEFIEEYETSLKDKVTFKSKYMFNDGVSRMHFLGLLNEYMFLYVRLYIVKNFVFSNQPYVEDPTTGLMAKIYSVYYEAIASKPDIPKQELQPDGSKKTVIYQEKIEAPILEYSILIKTEDDTWSSNMDNEVKKQIKEYMLRDTKAFIFHRYKNVYCFTVCQNAERTNKQYRELDSFYMTIIQRVEIPGARKRNAVLSFIQKIIDSYLEKKQVKFDLTNQEATYRRNQKIDYYKKLYRATMKEKYLEKIERIYQKERKPKGNLFYKLSALNAWLIEKIEWNAREYGLIRITATISDQPVAANVKEINLRDLANRKKPLYHESYRVDFYFNMKDTMGRYNTHFMSNVFENRALKSEIDIMDVPNWDTTMELSREAMLHMGYPAGNRLYGITEEEIFNSRYKVKEEKGEKKNEKK